MSLGGQAVRKGHAGRLYGAAPGVGEGAEEEPDAEHNEEPGQDPGGHQVRRQAALHRRG